MKELFRSLLRRLAAPLRRRYRQRNGVDMHEERKELPNDVLLGLVRSYMQEGHTATISVKGVSMRPFLEHERDKVELAPCSEVHDYDAVLAEITPGHYVLHRVIAIEGDRVTLMGDGNVRGTENCRLRDVVGVVTKYIRPRRTILASDPQLQRRIRQWRTLLPIRRYLLFVYKELI